MAPVIVNIFGSASLNLHLKAASDGPLLLPSQDIPRTLELIRNDWLNPSSLNRRSASALVAMLQRKVEESEKEERECAGLNRKEIDVLVTAVENSLWVAEQFAADLQNCECSAYGSLGNPS